MASRRQIIANRRNAFKSTGPRTAAGKSRSRRNAVKHGLTAETVITILENADDYDAFERVIINQHRPASMIERQFLIRLASLLWRLRRVTAIETGLFSIQAQIQKERRDLRTKSTMSLQHLFGISQGLPEVQAMPISSAGSMGTDLGLSKNKASRDDPFAPSNDSTSLPLNQTELLAQCFLRVARLDDQILKRLNRYEVALWRQAAGIFSLLHRMRCQNNCKRIGTGGA